MHMTFSLTVNICNRKAKYILDTYQPLIERLKAKLEVTMMVSCHCPVNSSSYIDSLSFGYACNCTRVRSTDMRHCIAICAHHVAAQYLSELFLHIFLTQVFNLGGIQAIAAKCAVQ